jgi:hypothetical protein
MIVEYVKKDFKTGYKKRKRRRKIGVLVGKLNDKNEIVVGHSKWCNRDEYNEELGYHIAVGRAECDSSVPPALSILKRYERFMKRCIKYFRTDKISTATWHGFTEALTQKGDANEIMT